MNYFNYFTEIEETFIRRRGKHLLLSPLDWALIENWKEREIPLRIILCGIENVFDTVAKNPARKINVKSLSYCKDEIESLYEDWRTSQVGKNADTSPDTTPVDEESIQQPNLFSAASIENHLEDVISDLKAATAKAGSRMRHTLESVLAGLTEQKEIYQDAESLEEKLEELESRIDEALLSSSAPDLLDRFRNEVEGELAKHKPAMEADVYRRTFDLMLLKKLRDEAGTPRLSLYYL